MRDNDSCLDIDINLGDSSEKEVVEAILKEPTDLVHRYKKKFQQILEPLVGGKPRI